jgi:hypothetical protein
LGQQHRVVDHTRDEAQTSQEADVEQGIVNDQLFVGQGSEQRTRINGEAVNEVTERPPLNRVNRQGEQANAISQWIQTTCFQVEADHVRMVQRLQDRREPGRILDHAVSWCSYLGRG